MKDNQCPVCGKPESEHKDGLFCCPFCGSDDIKLAKGDDSRWTLWYFSCECGAEMWDESKEKLKELWKTRA